MASKKKSAVAEVSRDPIEILADARLEMEAGKRLIDYVGAIQWALKRSAALARIVGCGANAKEREQIPEESVVMVMGIMAEEIEAADVLVGRMYRLQGGKNGN